MLRCYALTFCCGDIAITCVGPGKWLSSCLEDIAGLYMDLGYVYFRIEPEEVVAENKVVLNMKIQEGDVAYINDIIIKGNSSITTAEILKMIEFEKGDKFSRSKLIQSQENLKKSKLFKADKVDLNIQPLEDLSKIHIEFTVEEK